MFTKYPFIHILFAKLGIDKSIAYSSGARVIQAITGIGSIFFIGKFLTGVEQGFYFTFGSLLAIQVFFELGLNNVITQFTAHENAKITYDEAYNPIGESENLSRLSSIIHFSVRWYSIISIVFFIIVSVVGLVFFNHSENTNDVNWQFPWLIVSFFSAVNLLASPIYAILNGLGRVKSISKIRFFQQIFIPLSSWVGLYLGIKLYVLGISLIIMFLIGAYSIFSSDMFKQLKQLWRRKGEQKISFLSEIWPLQWKMGLSWISGYFIYQLFNPLLFHFVGAEAAGKMGMTLQVLNAAQAFSFSWMGTKIPFYSTMIAQKKYRELDILFNRTLRQLLVVCCFILCLFFISLYWVDDIFPFKIKEKFLDGVPLLVMCLSILSNQALSSFANYLRCHKQEPLVFQSIIVSLLCAASSFFCTKYWGVLGLTVSYASIITFISLPWIYQIYKYKKNEWHKL